MQKPQPRTTQDFPAPVPQNQDCQYRNSPMESPFRPQQDRNQLSSGFPVNQQERYSSWNQPSTGMGFRARNSSNQDFSQNWRSQGIAGNMDHQPEISMSWNRGLPGRGDNNIRRGGHRGHNRPSPGNNNWTSSQQGWNSRNDAIRDECCFKCGQPGHYAIGCRADRGPQSLNWGESV